MQPEASNKLKCGRHNNWGGESKTKNNIIKPATDAFLQLLNVCCQSHKVTLSIVYDIGLNIPERQTYFILCY